MGYKAYESLINLSLMWQMKNMIAMATGVKLIASEHRNSLFRDKIMAESMEAKYGFRYPGEVLERYHERCGDSLQNLRALATALADGKELLEDQMFIGNQKSSFIRRIREKAEEDVYLKAALYVLTEGKAEKEKLASELRQYEPHDTQEFFYLISILAGRIPGNDSELERFAYFLSEGRTLEAYGNEKIFYWALEHMELLDGGRRNGKPKIVKNLSRLVFHQVKEKSVYWDALADAGYSGQEIMYLNMKLPLLSESDDAPGKDSIIVERIVANACEKILNAEHVENPMLYQEIAHYLFLYDDFEIKLEGYRGLPELLRGKVVIRDVDLFMDFYKRKDEKTIFYEWFRVDLLDDRWDKLVSLMRAEEYVEFFETCMFFCGKNNGKAWLEKYEKLCGKSYLLRFWTENGSYVTGIFRNLVKEGVIDASDYICRYAEELKNSDSDAVNDKWRHMLSHIAKTVDKMDSPIIFHLWDTFDRLLSMEALRKLTNEHTLVSRAIGYEQSYYTSWHYNVERNFWNGLEFLTEDEQRKMFYWAEDEVYMYYPERYDTFLLCFLERKALELFPKAQCRDLADILLITVKPESYVVSKMRTLFYEKDEIEKFHEEERMRKIEEEKIREENNRRNWRQELYRGVSEGRTSLGVLGRNFDRYISQGAYQELVYTCIREEMDKGNCRVELKNLSYLLRSMGEIAESKASEWDDVRRMINRLEVVEDEPGKDKEQD